MCDRPRRYRWACRQQTADHALGFVGLSHAGSRLCVRQTEVIQVGVQAAVASPSWEDSDLLVGLQVLHVVVRWRVSVHIKR